MPQDLSIYIHIPYCKSRCSYCDFHSCAVGDSEGVPDDYISALIKKIPDREFKTAYIGGGTPSLLSKKQLTRICEAVNVVKNGEFTIEANPDSVCENWLFTALENGINRISFGVQSFDADILKLLGRRHDANSAKNGIIKAKNCGFGNISIDAMLGLSADENFESFVQFADDNGVNHISCYMLKLEDGTPLKTSFEKGLVTLPDSDTVAENYEKTTLLFEQYGYGRYEISNFAKNGYEGKHNLRYWDCENYLGIGAGAHSCVDGKRYFYERDTRAFIDGCQHIDDGFCGVEDYIILQTRLSSGLDLTALKERFGYELTERQTSFLYRCEKEGFLTFKDEKIILTTKGLLMQNSILAEIINP